MTNDSQRIFKLEGLIARMGQQILSLQIAVGQLRQNAVSSAGNSGFQGGGGGGSTLFCQPTAAIAAATGITTPGGPLTGQTVWGISGGSFVSVSTTAVIYNPMDDPTVATNNLVVSLNADGTYSAVSQSC
jgi:hypothetical protein